MLQLQVLNIFIYILLLNFLSYSLLQFSYLLILTFVFLTSRNALFATLSVI